MKNNICTDKTGIDKYLHLFCAYIIADSFGTFFAPFPGINEWIAAIIAFSVAIVVGILKELYDRTKAGNHFCVWDLCWDAVGAFIGAIATWVSVFGHNIHPAS